MPDRHGIVRQHLVVPNSPEPLVLQAHVRSLVLFMNGRLMFLELVNIQISRGEEGFCTLKTNFSPLRTAMVSKCPSHMSGPWSGLSGFDGLVGRGGGGGGGTPDFDPVRRESGENGSFETTLLNRIVSRVL